jgi:hypothetical protein
MADPDDEANWADAEEVLDRWRPEPGERRMARERQDQRLFRAAVVLAGLVLLLALVVLAVDPPPDPGGEPAWRGITGLSVAGLGLLFMFVAFALRVPRRWVPLTWGNPLRELTSRQRKQLLQQVRGRTPLPPERTRLARYAAQDLLGRRASLVLQTGLLVVFLGSWIADRSLVRTLLTLAFVTVYALAAVQAHRDAVRARRFLDEHPGS